MNDLVKTLNGDVALSVKFLGSHKTIHINADKQFWAASVIKIPVACEFFRQVEAGSLKKETRVKVAKINKVEGTGILAFLDKDTELTLNDLAILMLDTSDNCAANQLIDTIGWENVEKYMTTLGLKNTTFRHKMMIKAGRGPNYTTASDMQLLLEKIYEEEIPGARDIVEILTHQQDRRRIPVYLPNTIKIAHKTGSLPQAVHDVGLIYAKEPFAFCFLSDNQKDKVKTSEVLAQCAKLCFDYTVVLK